MKFSDFKSLLKTVTGYPFDPATSLVSIDCNDLASNEGIHICGFELNTGIVGFKQNAYIDKLDAETAANGVNIVVDSRSNEPGHLTVEQLLDCIDNLVRVSGSGDLQVAVLDAPTSRYGAPLEITKIYSRIEVDTSGEAVCTAHIQLAEEDF